MRRNHRWASAALIAAAALTVTACSHNTYGAGSASGTQSNGGGAYSSPYGAKQSGAPAGSQATTALKTEAIGSGTVLASPKGMTLYYYTGDRPGSGQSACTGGCATAWPPLAAPVSAPPGARLPGPLAMITRPGGAKQVTINGYPIYTYADDMAPGQAKGNGEAGEWHVIKLAGASAVRVLTVTRTSAGRVLASPKGLTLYYYTGDKPGSGRSACTGGCAAAWPALVAPVKAPPGAQLPGMGTIGFITRPDGTKQVTLNGYPLYRYAEDTASGQAKGNGEDGEWHVIKV